MGWSGSKDYPHNKVGIQTIHLVLFQFERNVSSDEVIQFFDERGSRPATLREILEFGKQYPNEPVIERIDTNFQIFPDGSKKPIFTLLGKYNIVVLGSFYPVRNDEDFCNLQLIPCVGRDSRGSRIIYPDTWEAPMNPHKWNTRYYFAAVSQ